MEILFLLPLMVLTKARKVKIKIVFIQYFGILKIYMTDYVTADTIRGDLQGYAPIANTLIQIGDNAFSDLDRFFKGITIEPYIWIDKKSGFTENDIYDLTYKLYNFNVTLIQLLWNLSSVNNLTAFPDINSIIGALDDCIKQGAQFQGRISILHNKVSPDKEREKIGGCVQGGTEEHKKLDYLHRIFQLKTIFDRRIDIINKQFPNIIDRLNEIINVSYAKKDIMAQETKTPPVGSRITIRLVEKGHKLTVNGDKLESTPKLLSNIICARAYGVQTAEALVKASAKFMRNVFRPNCKVGRTKWDIKNQKKNLGREIKRINSLFPQPIIKWDKKNAEWIQAGEQYINFQKESSNKLLSPNELRDFIQPYLSSVRRTSEEVRKSKTVSPKSKTFTTSPDKIDYAANPSKESIQKRREGKKAYEESDDDNN
ncbi:MAG: hypothetical protein HY811_10150 [Planctomycetes bacterium]|nr:hypothetical protein [Planctomycetota bacterium]